MPGLVIPDLHSVEVPTFKKVFVAARRAGTVGFKQCSRRAFSLFAPRCQTRLLKTKDLILPLPVWNFFIGSLTPRGQNPSSP